MTRADEVERAARALVTQLDVTGLATIGIYAVAAVHGCVYDGPTYKDEKEALRAALAMPREATPVAWVRVEHPAWPAYGYCPTCGGSYARHGAGLIRRHGNCPKKVACRYTEEPAGPLVRAPGAA